jgi:hypothetical protein
MWVPQRGTPVHPSPYLRGRVRDVRCPAAAGTVGVLIVLLAAYGLYVIRSIIVLVLVGLFVAISLDPVCADLGSGACGAPGPSPPWSRPGLTLLVLLAWPASTGLSGGRTTSPNAALVADKAMTDATTLPTASPMKSLAP